MAGQTSREELLTLTAEIVSSYVANNTLPAGDIPAVIGQVFKTLANVNADADVKAAGRPKPAVPIKKSVNPDYLVCLEDGKRLKMLKRHLQTAYRMSPEDYRQRWGLAPDYPMVAPNYARQRSQLAKDIGLGTKRKRRSSGARS